MGDREKERGDPFAAVASDAGAIPYPQDANLHRLHFLRQTHPPVGDECDGFHHLPPGPTSPLSSADTIFLSLSGDEAEAGHPLGPVVVEEDLIISSIPCIPANVGGGEGMSSIMEEVVVEAEAKKKQPAIERVAEFSNEDGVRVGHLRKTVPRELARKKKNRAKKVGKSSGESSPGVSVRASTRVTGNLVLGEDKRSEKGKEPELHDTVAVLGDQFQVVHRNATGTPKTTASGSEAALRKLPESIRGLGWSITWHRTPLPEGKNQVQEKAAETLSTEDQNLAKGEIPNSAFPANILDVINAFSKMPDKNLENVDILEIAESRGIHFPAPRWWRPGGYGPKKDKDQK